MTIREVLKNHQNLEIELLLAHVLKKPKEFLLMYGEYRLTRIQANRLTPMIKRREKGEPVAYILGYKDFMGRRFKVNKDVLIPRPETEELVERIMKYELRSMGGKPIRILDMGTGSGCISISLAKVLFAKLGKEHLCQIVASDISKKALGVARENARTHKVKIEFIHSNILQNVGMSLDIIVANLPYVPEADYRLLIKDLRYEPKSAIFAKEKGLYLIRKLLFQVAGLKQKPKYIFLEFDPRQKAALSNLIKKILPDSGQKFYKDLAGKWRMVEIRVR